jgi:hypothetical protein
MSDVTDDIKSTAASITADAAVLQALETAKAQVDPTDPAAQGLAAEAERLASTILRKTKIERSLVEDAG